MTQSSPKLSLKLSPEASKVLPFLIAAKKRGNPKEIEWATYEYECAEARARDRKRWERDVQDRRERIEWEKRLVEEEQEREYLAWLEVQRKEDECLEKCNPHWALEDGLEEFQPTQSSQQGWRRLLSEYPQRRDFGLLGLWGDRRDRPHSNQNYSKHNKYRGSKPNCGRKRRTFRDYK